MIPTGIGHLDETRAFAGAEEIARDDERVAKERGAVARAVIAGEGEERIDVGRVDELLPFVVVARHVSRVATELAALARLVDRVDEIPSLRQARGAIGMRERRQSGLRGLHGERAVRGRKIT